MGTKLKVWLALPVCALIGACGGGDDGADAPPTGGGTGTGGAPTPPAIHTGFPGGTWEPSAALYGVEAVDTSVTMSDGAVLTTRMSYPTDLATGRRVNANFPVIVEHTPYVAGTGFPVPAENLTYYTQRGYIYAHVRARGTATSTGEVQWSGLRDGLDGREIADWASKVANSDGRVALIGCSYPAAIALRTASVIGPNSPVKAMVAACNGFSSQNRGAFWRGGLQVQQMGIFLSLQGLLGNTPSSIRYFREVYDNMVSGGSIAYEGDFWAEKHKIDLAPAVQASGIPILFWSGWQDPVEGAVRSYTSLQNAHAGRHPFGPMIEGQAVTPRYQLIMGDWGHAQGLDIGVTLQWIETWLKGVNTGIQNTTTPAHVADPGLGANVWSNISRFPMAASNTRWYLDSGSTLNAAAPSTSGTAQVRWVNPQEAGGRVSFLAPPIVNGTTLSGSISATVYASSNNTNLMLIARLIDVAPDGTEVEITAAPVLGSQRELDLDKTWADDAGNYTWPWPKLDRDQYLMPQRVYRFDIEMLARHWSVKPGHRLRLDLMGQTPPNLCSAPGTARSRGADVCYFTPQQQASLAGGVYTIRTGPPWPSSVNLPQIPFGTVSTVPSAIVPTETTAPVTPTSRRRPLPIVW